ESLVPRVGGRPGGRTRQRGIDFGDPDAMALQARFERSADGQGARQLTASEPQAGDLADQRLRLDWRGQLRQIIIGKDDRYDAYGCACKRHFVIASGFSLGLES